MTKELNSNQGGRAAASRDDSTDLSMLSWCAAEISQALATADEHLTKQLSADSDDTSMLGVARSSLHQAHGALAMVDLPGTTQLTAEAETLLTRVDEGELAFSADLVNKLTASFSAINSYLGELMRGDRQQPLRLFPYLKDLLELREAERVHPADLFFPAVGKMPAPEAPLVDLDEHKKGLVRAQFENGLLGALRDEKDTKSLGQMSDAIHSLAHSTLAEKNLSFWLVADAYFGAMQSGDLALDEYGKRLLARINMQLRRTLQDGSPVADRLLWDTLFSVACGSPTTDRLAPVFEAYELHSLVPKDFETPRYRKVDQKTMQAASSAISDMKKTWESMLAQPGGVNEFLGQFKQALSQFRDASEDLGVEGLDRLTSGWVGVVKELGLDTNPVSDAVGVEVATSLLFVEQLFEYGLKEFEDLPGRCADLARRIDATLLEAQVDEEAPQWLQELTAAVQERLTLTAFTAETQSALREAEGVLDTYFREPEKGVESLPTAAANLNQIAGILGMLGHQDAADAAKHLASLTDQIAGGDELEGSQLADMAGSIGTLGFFLDAIKGNPRSLPEFTFDRSRGVFEQVRVKKEEAHQPDVNAELDADGVSEELPEESAQVVLDRQLVLLDEALLKWAESPDSADDQMAVSELLQNVADGAQLTESPELSEATQEAIEIASSQQANAALAIAAKLGRPVALAEEGSSLPEPVAVQEQPEVEEDEVDEELLEIFLAEASEVLEAIEQSEQQLASTSDDQMVLTTVRRGFHTLKGSSRMVGLDSFGEAAWSLEQVLNAWLAEEKSANDDLLKLIAQAREVFTQWVASLEPDADRTPRPSADTLMARAEAMRDGGSFDSVRDAAVPDAEAVPGASMVPAADLEEPLSPVEDLELEAAVVESTAEASAESSADAEAPTTDAIGFELEASAEAEADVDVPAIEAFDSTAMESMPVELPSLPSIDDMPSESSADSESVVDFPPADLVEPYAFADSPAEASIDEPSLDDIIMGDQPEATDEQAAQELESIEAIEADALEALDTEALALDADEIEADELEASEPEVNEPEVSVHKVEDGDESVAVHEAAETVAAFDGEVEANAEQPEAAEPVEPASDVVIIGEREISRPLFKVFTDEVNQLRAVLVPDAEQWCEEVSRDANESARRAMHSLKGSAALVQIDLVSALASSLEQFLVAQIAAPVSIEKADVVEYSRLVGVLFAALDQFVGEQQPTDQPEAVEAAEALMQRWEQMAQQPVAPVASATPAPSQKAVREDELPQVQDEFDDELLPLFVAEAEEYLPQIDENLRAWLKTPADAKLQQLIMRQFHTVKGSARMAGAMVLGQRVHDMETRVEEAMALDDVPVSLIEELLAEQDIVSEQFEYIRDPSLKPQTDDSSQADTAQPDQALADGADSAGADAEAGRAAQGNPVVRVRSELLDKLVNEAGEVSIARSRLDNSVGGLRQAMTELAENVNRLRAHVRELEMQGEMRIQAHNANAESNNGDFDPLEFDRFTRFQELTRMMSESVNDVGTVQANATRAIEDAMGDLSRQGQTLRGLQHNLMGIRMVQFGTVSDRLYRVVRQAAKSLGKRVSLDIRGAVVQMDRGVLEKMVAPLEHLLRNAVSHGIEAPAVREAAGKREAGDIRLEIMQDGNEIMITLTDDGGGLNFGAIRERAVERDLISAKEKVTDQKLADLIFMPGFSTAEGVDQISGRGVGMDVVRSEVSLLNGRVQVDSTARKGTRFMVHLPLTMAVEQVMLVTVGERSYAVPSANVEQVLQLDPDQLAKAYGERAVSWQDEQVPLFYAGSLVHAGDQQVNAQHATPVMILRSGGQRIAVHADEVGKSQEVVVKNVGIQVGKVVGIAGATLMGNGDVVLILNFSQLAAQLTESEQEAAMRAGMAAGMADAPATVMVVDDSVTVRKVTQRFLVRESFDVLLAKDGVDALRQLEERIPDVMLVDVEMPRMDGFDLTRALRKDARFRNIPVVMITSRTADKHRNFAMSLGVNEYLGKPYDETQLLGLINGYVAQQKSGSIH
ncbi:MAG: Hpt domain-containing protein [Burkholderiaceae bacterium]